MTRTERHVITDKEVLNGSENIDPLERKNSNLMRHLLQRLRIKRFSTGTQEYTIQDFKQKYPISMNDNKSRRNAFDVFADDLEPFDKHFLMPLRNWLADITTSNWINIRFRENPSDPPYLQSQFVQGAEGAIRRFFHLLQEDINQTGKEPDDVKLEDVLTKNLYKEFQYHHQQFQSLGLDLQIRLNHISNFKKGENFMEFGPPERVTTTLQKAQIHTAIAPYVFWRYNPTTKKWLFREVTFEYDVSPNDIDLSEDELEVPTLRTRSELTRMGAVVGIDVTADVDMTVIIKSDKDEWVESMRRHIVFKFETTHFVGKYKGTWRIADVDNLYASQMLNE